MYKRGVKSSMQYDMLGVIPDAIIKVDPLDKYPKIEPEDLLKRYWLVFEHLTGIDFKKESLDEVWKVYGFCLPEKIVPPLTVEKDIFKYKGDPDLYPIIEIWTEIKGYPESLLFYPHDWCVYKKNGEYINKGRMD